MRRLIILVAIIAIAFAGCKKSGSAGEAGSSNQSTPSAPSASSGPAAVGSNVALTEELVMRYLDTLPEFTKLGLRTMGNNPNRISMVEATKLIEAHIRGKGWSTPQDFYTVNAKMAKAMGYVSYKQNAALMRHLPAEARAERDKEFKTQMKDFTPEEVALIDKHAAKIYSTLMKAAMGR